MIKIICESFFPEEYAIIYLEETKNGYEYGLLSRSLSARCPNCNQESHRMHSYQEKEVQDLQILGRGVRLRINQIKYFCDNPSCDDDIFTERNDFIDHYKRYTTRCSQYMLKVATHVSCEAASKILGYQGIEVSGDKLLIMLKEAGARYEQKPVKKIGVDDWAYRKGQKYGTIICDLETHKIIEVLEGRDRETLKKWLKGHNDIEIVSRDRASAYSSAVSNVLPEAVQIADRFHITQNLLDALKTTMKTFMPEILEMPHEEPLEAVTSEINPEIKGVLKKTQRVPNKTV